MFGEAGGLLGTPEWGSSAEGRDGWAYVCGDAHGAVIPALAASLPQPGVHSTTQLCFALGSWFFFPLEVSPLRALDALVSCAEPKRRCT